MIRYGHGMRIYYKQRTTQEKGLESKINHDGREAPPESSEEFSSNYCSSVLLFLKTRGAAGVNPALISRHHLTGRRGGGRPYQQMLPGAAGWQVG